MKKINYQSITELVHVYDNLRKPVNSVERKERIKNKKQSDLYPYYGATGQVDLIDDYLIDGEYVLVGEDGAPFLDPFKNKSYIISGKVWVNNHAHILKAIDGRAHNAFICYYLNFFNYNGYVNGSTRLKLTKNRLEQIPVPVFNFEEQKKIVKKIDALFAEIDAAIAEIKTIQKQLELYKQSVLNAAIRGLLVPQDPKDEPAFVLLEKIRAEKDLLIKAGKLKKEKILPTINLNDIQFELPRGWEWTRLGTITISSTYGSSTKTYKEYQGLPVLGMGHIQNCDIDYSKLKYLPKEHDEFPELLLESGDLLFNRTNSAELVGKCAIYKGLNDSTSFASYLIRLRFSKVFVEPEFIAAIINSSYGRAWVRSVMAQQVGQANVNGTKLAQLLIPLPPFEEQQRIVAMMQKTISLINITQQKIMKLNQSKLIFKQALLKHAFEGKLI